jgi:hypothetical protein
MEKYANKKCLICNVGFVWTEKGMQDKSIFKCNDCLDIFHKKCMPRDNNCSICQLKNISPLQKSRS